MRRLRLLALGLPFDISPTNMHSSYTQHSSWLAHAQVRKRDDQTYVYFKETSIYRPRDEKADKSSTLSKTSQKLLYVEAIVQALDKAEAEALAKGVGYQGSVATIKDKWWFTGVPMARPARPRFSQVWRVLLCCYVVTASIAVCIQSPE